MITVQIPSVTINQFDVETMQQMVADLAAARADVAAMRQELSEILDAWRQELTDIRDRLKAGEQRLGAAIAAQPTITQKE